MRIILRPQRLITSRARKVASQPARVEYLLLKLAFFPSVFLFERRTFETSIRNRLKSVQSRRRPQVTQKSLTTALSRRRTMCLIHKRYAKPHSPRFYCRLSVFREFKTRIAGGLTIMRGFGFARDVQSLNLQALFVSQSINQIDFICRRRS